MEVENIIAIVAMIVAVVMAIFTTFMSISSNLNSYKKDKRGIPLVAIWVDNLDNIDNKLKQNYRWFIEKNDIDEIIKNNYCYFCVYSNSSILYNCSVNIYEKEIDKDNCQSNNREVKIGTVDMKNRKVVPMKTYANKMKFVISIEYDTIEYEHFRYLVEFEYDAIKHHIYQRDDNLYIKKHAAKFRKNKLKGYKHLANYNNTISDSYSESEINDWLNGRSLNK